MGYCRHLDVGEDGGGESFRCRIHGGPEFPRLCADYNCVSWAKANDMYDGDNPTLARAQETLDRLRAEGAWPPKSANATWG